MAAPSSESRGGERAAAGGCKGRGGVGTARRDCSPYACARPAGSVCLSFTLSVSVRERRDADANANVNATRSRLSSCHERCTHAGTHRDPRRGRRKVPGLRHRSSTRARSTRRPTSRPSLRRRTPTPSPRTVTTMHSSTTPTTTSSSSSSTSALLLRHTTNSPPSSLTSLLPPPPTRTPRPTRLRTPPSLNPRPRSSNTHNHKHGHSHRVRAGPPPWTASA